VARGQVSSERPDSMRLPFPSGRAQLDEERGMRARWIRGMRRVSSKEEMKDKVTVM
jgi:hypothetical protein